MICAFLLWNDFVLTLLYVSRSFFNACFFKTIAATTTTSSGSINCLWTARVCSSSRHVPVSIWKACNFPHNKMYFGQRIEVYSCNTMDLWCPSSVLGTFMIVKRDFLLLPAHDISTMFDPRTWRLCYIARCDVTCIRYYEGMQHSNIRCILDNCIEV